MTRGFGDRVWRPLLERPIAYVSRQLDNSSVLVTVDLYGHFIPVADRHHVGPWSLTSSLVEQQRMQHPRNTTPPPRPVLASKFSS